MPSLFVDVCKFSPTAGGTTDFTVSSPAVGYQTPAAAGAVNGSIYSYRAESADLSQWEVGFGAYNTGTGVLSRTTVLFNSSGTTAKIAFSAVPTVALVALAEDLLPIANVAPIVNTLGFDVATNASTYVDGPSVAQGSVGTWFASGTVTVVDSAGTRGFGCKLWDGTTLIASGFGVTAGAGFSITISLSGFIAAPSGNLRMSVIAGSGTTGSIAFNRSGLLKDSTITAYRIK